MKPWGIIMVKTSEEKNWSCEWSDCWCVSVFLWDVLWRRCSHIILPLFREKLDFCASTILWLNVTNNQNNCYTVLVCDVCERRAFSWEKVPCFWKQGKPVPKLTPTLHSLMHYHVWIEVRTKKIRLTKKNTVSNASGSLIFWNLNSNSSFRIILWSGVLFLEKPNFEFLCISATRRIKIMGEKKQNKSPDISWTNFRQI